MERSESQSGISRPLHENVRRLGWAATSEISLLATYRPRREFPCNCHLRVNNNAETLRASDDFKTVEKEKHEMKHEILASRLPFDHLGSVRLSHI